MSNEQTFTIFNIHPVGETGWLSCEIHELEDNMRGYGDGDTKQWVIEIDGPMTRAQIDAQPEFDGW